MALTATHPLGNKVEAVVLKYAFHYGEITGVALTAYGTTEVKVEDTVRKVLNMSEYEAHVTAIKLVGITGSVPAFADTDDNGVVKAIYIQDSQNGNVVEILRNEDL